MTKTKSNRNINKKIEYWYITDPEKDWKGQPTTEIEEDPTYRLADMCTSAAYDSLPAADIERAKQGILDTIAAMMAGSDYGYMRDFINEQKQFTGDFEANFFFWGDGAPATEAAVINGTMAAIAHYDDVHEEAGRISGYLVPAMLSALHVLKTKMDTVVSGKEFLTAFIVGAEWNVRYGMAARYMKHRFGTPGNVGGGISQAAAIARMAGLNSLQLVNACAFNFCSNCFGEGESAVEGSDARDVNFGIYASDAIMGTMFAKEGLTAPTAFYFGKSGIFRLMVWDDAKPELLTENLGTEWKWTKGLKFRPYPKADIEACKDDVSWEELNEKLHVGAGLCKSKYTEEQLQKITNMVRNLECLEDVTELADLLIP